MEGGKETYTVKVLILSPDVEKSVLSREFERYGPIRRIDIVRHKKGKKAFIHFYSKEVAEVAANEMDDKIINGTRIEASFIDPKHEENHAKESITEDYVLEQNGMGEYFNQHGLGSNHFNTKDTHKMALQDKQTSKPFSSSMGKSGANCLTSQMEQPAPQETPRKDAERKFVGIYWDIENCQLPSSIEPQLFVEKIRNKFLQGKKLEEFVCFCDNTQIKKSVIDGLSRAEVDVLHVSAAAKNAADDKLKLRMHDFGYKYPNQATVILISGDVNFAPVLNRLRYSLGLHVILLHNKQASSNLTNLANENFRFGRFISDLSINITPDVGNNVVRTTELIVRNLPTDPSMIQMARTRLNILSDNCGGRVGNIQQDIATGSANCIISFASANDADRALCRMQGGDVCGRAIQVEHYWGMDQSKASKDGPASVINTSFPGKQKQRPKTANLQKSVSLNVLPGSSGGKHSQKTNQISFESLIKARTSSTTQTIIGTVGDPSKKPGQPSNMKMGSSTSTIKNPKPKELKKEQTISDKVQRILCEFPHWLSFEKFVTKFKENFKDGFDVRQFSKLKNVLVDGKPGKMFVCLTGSSMSSVPVGIEKSDFHEKLISILEMHKRAVQISALPGLMWSYNKKILRPNASGIPLRELIATCPNVKSKDSTIFLSEPSYDAKRNADRFIAETLHLLTSAKNWECPVESFTASFERFFGTKISGLSNFEKVLAEVATGILEVVQRNGTRYLTVAVPKRKEILSKELRNMLAAEKTQWLPIHSLPTKYYTFYGRKISCRENMRSLVDLIKAMKKQGFYIFQGKDKVPCFGQRKVSGQSFNDFKRGLIELLRNRSENKILMGNLEHEYKGFHGSCPQLMNLGFDHPNHLFAALMPDIAVKKFGNDLCIVLRQNDSSSLWEDVLKVVFESKEKAVLLCTLPEKIQGRGDSLFSSVPPFITVLGSGETACFVVTEKYEELVAEDAVTSVCKILYGSPGYEVHFQEVLDRLEGGDVQKKHALEMAVKSGKASVQGHTIILGQKAALRYFAFEVLSLLYELPDKTCTLDRFCGLYHKKFGRQYRVADFGCKKAVEVFNAIAPDMIQVTSSSSVTPGANTFVLSPSPSGIFIEEAKRLLIDKNGLVFLDDLVTLFKRISSPHEPHSDISGMLESYSELFAIFSLKSTTSEHNLVLLKHFSISLETGYKANMNKNKTEEKLPPQMQTVKNEAEQGDKSDGHHMSDVKSSAEDGSIVVEKNDATKKKKSKKRGKKKKPVPILENIPDDDVNNPDFGASQKSSCTDSSDDASVIIEDDELVDLGSELVDLSNFVDSNASSQSANEIDLLSFGGTDSESDMDWWIQGVPDHLPSPAIRPEPITFERHGMVGDLISLGDDCDENDKGNGNEESNLIALDDPGSEIHSDLHGLKIQ